MSNFKYIDGTELPSDPGGYLGQTRREVRKAYNFNRGSVHKLELLRSTLQFITNAIDAGFKADDHDEALELNKQYDKDKSELQATKINLSLDKPTTPKGK